LGLSGAWTVGATQSSGTWRYVLFPLSSFLFPHSYVDRAHRRGLTSALAWGQILSGCDYLPSIHGVGLKKAHGLLRKFKTVARAVQHLRLEGFPVPADYAQRFRLAELTFCHQRVFDPSLGEVVPLSPLPDGCAADEDAFIGPCVAPCRRATRHPLLDRSH
jgi:hypothetical protein